MKTSIPSLVIDPCIYILNNSLFLSFFIMKKQDPHKKEAQPAQQPTSTFPIDHSTASHDGKLKEKKEKGPQSQHHAMKI